MPSITIDNSADVRLYFTDSGPPQNQNSTSRSTPYTTIIAVHGMGFNGAIFKRLQQASASTNMRVVAVNRRCYQGSTKFSELEWSSATTGGNAEKAHFLNARGIELANFIEIFVDQYQIPPIAADNTGGGVILLGWSAGCGTILSTIANTPNLPQKHQAVLKEHIRALVLLGPPSVMCGLNDPPKTWLPYYDPTIPKELHDPFFTQWITSYFDHGDLSTRNVDILSYIVPSFYKRPSVYNMSPEDIKEIIEEGMQEMVVIPAAKSQAADIYNKALFDSTTRLLLPKMKIWVLAGEHSSAVQLSCLWNIQSDVESRGGTSDFINFKIIPGVNHFMHWDEPELTLRVLEECIE